MLTRRISGTPDPFYPALAGARSRRAAPARRRAKKPRLDTWLPSVTPPLCARLYPRLAPSHLQVVATLQTGPHLGTRAGGSTQPERGVGRDGAPAGQDREQPVARHAHRLGQGIGGGAGLVEPVAHMLPKMDRTPANPPGSMTSARSTRPALRSSMVIGVGRPSSSELERTIAETTIARPAAGRDGHSPTRRRHATSRSLLCLYSACRSSQITHQSRHGPIAFLRHPCHARSAPPEHCPPSLCSGSRLGAAPPPPSRKLSEGRYRTVAAPHPPLGK